MSTKRHKLFISYHHDLDEYYRNRFEYLFSSYYDIMDSRAVQIGDIPDGLKTYTVRQKIRDDYIADATVTAVLIGKNTWRRKHIDWEIGSSIRDTKKNKRTGLFGIILPTYPNLVRNIYNPYTIPPRLHDNIACNFAQIYYWSEKPGIVQNWIHKAFEDRFKITPDNSYPSFGKNRITDSWCP